MIMSASIAKAFNLTARIPVVYNVGDFFSAECSQFNLNVHIPLVVSWYGLSYGPAQNKKIAIGTDLAFADILILMLEMSDELDRLGCPIDMFFSKIY